MRRTIIILLVALSSLTCIFATNLIKTVDDMKELSDTQLHSIIEELYKKDLPADAIPYLKEAERRAELQHDTKSMLKWLNYENSFSYGGGRREAFEECLNELMHRAWSPLRQMLYLNYGHFMSDDMSYNDYLTEKVFDNGDKRLTALPASEVTDTSEFVISLKICDYMAIKLYYDGRLDYEVWRVWYDMVRTSGNRESEALAVSIALLSDYNECKADTSLSMERLNTLCSTAASRVMYELVDTKMCIDTISYDEGVSTQQQIVSDNALIDKACAFYSRLTSDYKGSMLAKLAQEELNKINEKGAVLSVEKKSLPDRAIPIAIRHRNVESLTLTIRRATDKTCVASEEVHLPVAHNKLHITTTYHEITPLPLGVYIIECSIGDKIFDSKVLTVSQLNVSRLSTGNKRCCLYVTDALTGMAVEGATFSYKGSKSVIATTDSHGLATIDNISKPFDNTLVVRKGNDMLSLQHTSYRYSNSNYNKLYPGALIVCDRNIYRPGQTLYFKVYGYYNSHMQSKCMKEGTTLRVRLTSTDGKEIYNKELSLNCFGTAHDSIPLSDDIQKGHASFSVMLDNEHLAYHNVNISEYKRTNNSITIKPFEGLYVCGDTLNIEGVSLSADSTPIANAVVKWHATLQSKDMEVQHLQGTTYTDNNGIFTFDTPTPESEYTNINVNIDITDVKGETTEENLYLHLTDVAYEVKVSAKENFSKGEKVTLSLSSVNFDDVEHISDVDIQIYDKRREVPYKASMDFDYYIRSIDNSTVSNTIVDIRSDKDKISDYKLIRIVAPQHYTIGKESIVTIDKELPEGHYEALVTYTTPDGIKREARTSFDILPTTDKCCYINDPLVLQTPDKVITGEPFCLSVGTGLESADIHVVVVCNKNIIAHKVLTAKSQLCKLTFNVEQDDILPTLKDIAVVAFTTRDNKTYTKHDYIDIVHPSKSLDVQLTTWRNTSSPKAHEQWKVRIANDTLTELLATMYDTRLDMLIGKMWRPRFNNMTLRSELSFIGSANIAHPTIAIKHRYLENYTTPSAEEILQALVKYDRHELEAMPYEAGAGMKGIQLHSTRKLGLARNMVTMDAIEEETMPQAEEHSEPLEETSISNIDVRNDFRETVFFMPALMPDSTGEYTIDFDMPDNLTTYRLRLLAHDATLRNGYKEELLTVRKELTVKGGVPRFIREDDEVEVTAEVRANNPEIHEVQCLMMVHDTLTGELVDMHPIHTLTFDSLQRTSTTKWRLLGIRGVDALKVTIVARCATHTDGEVSIVKVLPSTVEVEESYPFVLFEKGQHTIAAPTDNVEHVQQWRFNYTSNTFMEALKALPHLDNERYPSADTYLGRVETNAIASFIRTRLDVNKAIKALRNDSTLNSTPLKGTFYDKRNKEIERHVQKVIGMLSNDNATRECNKALRKLSSLQKNNGGIAWCKGMEESEFMTASVVEMLGWLVRYGMIDGGDITVSKMCHNATRYIDNRLTEELNKAKEGNNIMSNYSMLYMAYARSYVDNKMPQTVKDSLLSLTKDWRKLDIQKRVMLATLMWRNNKQDIARTMLRSISQNLVVKDEVAYLSLQGVSWWDNDIYIQSMLAQLMKEATPDDDNSRRLINWLMMQKRTEHWGNTQSTSRAVMSLITASSDNSSTDNISVGGKEYSLSVEVPSMTTLLTSSSAENNMTATINKDAQMPSWGSWTSYSHTPIDVLTQHNTDEMSIKRDILIERNGTYLPLNGQQPKVGDKLKIQITIKCNVAMDYVRITDYRPSALEPTDQISSYRWRLGRGMFMTPHFYSPSDTDVTFLCQHLSRGEHTFSYETYVTNEGTMAGGYAEAECLYCRDFSIHSEGKRLSTLAVER